MKEEKKFFVPDVFTGNLDIKKKWFVFYYEPLVNGHFPKRIKVYEGINRIKTIEGRLKKAEEIFLRIRKDKPVVYGFKKPVKNRVDSVLLDVLEAMKNYSDPKTIATYEGMVRKFHVFITGRHDKQATREDALAFVNHLFDKKLSGKTVIRPNELRQLKVEYVNLSAGYIEL